MKKDIITVSTVTFNATWGDKAKNLNRIKGYIEAAAKKVPILLFSRKWHLPVMMMKRKNQRPKNAVQRG